ncbi:hypothetical protein RSOL_188110, partial [Rhizoctonia solani AG-3 Rhs1AP]
MDAPGQDVDDAINKDDTIPDDAPPKILREALQEAQLARNEQHQANLDKDCEINKLQDQIGRKRARVERFQEKTPQDLNEILFRTFSAIAFGAGSLQEPQPKASQGQLVLAKMVGMHAITPGAIAFTAVLAHWCISPYETFTEEGDKTGIKWLKDYRAYKKIIIEGTRKEKDQVERGFSQGPFLRLMSEWNKQFFPNFGTQNKNEGPEGDGESSDNDSDVADVLAEIDEFVDGEEDLDE